MKFRKNENFKYNDNLLEFNDVNKIYISKTQLKNDKDFICLIKVGDEVKIGTPLLKNSDGQKILSSVSGKVLNISTKTNIFNNLSQFIEIENNKKNEREICEKPDIKNKSDFINMCKDFGLANNEFYLYSFFEKLKENKTLYVFGENDDFNFINKIIFKNFHEEIIKTVEIITKLFKPKKVVFCLDKNDKKTSEILTKNNYKISKKSAKTCINFADLFNVFNALNGVVQTDIFVSIYGSALKNNGVVKMPNGTQICDVINFLGGFKQDIEEIENYKYTALLAYNDELELKNKIKNCKNELDKNRLIKLLEQKQKEAKENVFDKLNDFYEKFLNCISCCIVNEIKKKNFIKDFERALQTDVKSLAFLSQKEFN